MGKLGCVNCNRIAKCIAPGNETSIQLPVNATVARSCLGTYDSVYYDAIDYDYEPKYYIVYFATEDFD